MAHELTSEEEAAIDTLRQSVLRDDNGLTDVQLRLVEKHLRRGRGPNRPEPQEQRAEPPSVTGIDWRTVGVSVGATILTLGVVAGAAVAWLLMLPR